MSIFLKIPDITGDASAKSYERAIEIHAVQTRSARSVTQRSGTTNNRTVSIPQTQAGSFIKSIDSSSAKIMHSYYSGKAITQLQFHHVTTGNSQSAYLVNTFYDVIISSHDELSSAEGVIEIINFYYTKSEKRYTTLDNSNKPTSPQSVGYDITSAEVL